LKIEVIVILYQNKKQSKSCQECDLKHAIAYNSGLNITVNFCFKKVSTNSTCNQN